MEITKNCRRYAILQSEPVYWETRKTCDYTSSQVSKLMGISPFCSRRKYWLKTITEKIPLVAAQHGIHYVHSPYNEHRSRMMMHGQTLEPTAIELYKKKILHKTEALSPPAFYVKEITRGDTTLTIGCTPDSEIVRPFCKGPLEIKCPWSRIYENMPEYYIPQVAIQMDVMGSDWAHFFVMYGDRWKLWGMTANDDDSIDYIYNMIFDFHEKYMVVGKGGLKGPNRMPRGLKAKINEELLKRYTIVPICESE